MWYLSLKSWPSLTVVASKLRRRRSNMCLQVGHALDTDSMSDGITMGIDGWDKGLIDADRLQAQLCCLDGTCRELTLRSKMVQNPSNPQLAKHVNRLDTHNWQEWYGVMLFKIDLAQTGDKSLSPESFPTCHWFETLAPGRIVTSSFTVAWLIQMRRSSQILP